MSKKSKQSIIRFSMDFLQSRVVSNVFTLNEIEFLPIANKLGIEI